MCVLLLRSCSLGLRFVLERNLFTFFFESFFNLGTYITLNHRVYSIRTVDLFIVNFPVVQDIYKEFIYKIHFNGVENP